MHLFGRGILFGVLVVGIGCVGGARTDEAGSRAPDSPSAQRAPWQQPPLAADAVPPVYLEQWRQAENRASCAPMAPDALRAPAEASARAARFSGGWGVAYDLPDLRSAFGVAGTGVEPSEDTYADWPNKKTWPDGSTVGYGPEGGDGPKSLAYLQISGQECLYNVWSQLGVDHLEFLLDHLRFIAH